MAPEQARAEPTDARVDIYALGIVLWESLIGEHVRPSTDRAETIAVAKTGELPAIDEDIPEELKSIIRHATAKDPGERYANARNMAEALDAFLLAERARDPGPAPATRLKEWLKHRWGDVEQDSIAPMPASAGAVVSFMDDGMDKLGARTMRSIAETAADEEVLRTPPAHQIIEDAPPDPRESQPLPAVVVEDQPQPVVVEPLRKRIRRWLPVVLFAVVAGGGVAGLAILRRPAGRVVPDAPAVVVDARPDAAIDAAIDAPPDAPIDAPIDAPMRLPVDANRVVTVRVDAAPKPPQGELRPILIGATPWANFYVDDDPTKYETPQTLKLTVGPHRVLFTNPQLGVTRTVTVTVPAEGEARHVEKMN
jgi:serine/threonine-protein kinase